MEEDGVEGVIVELRLSGFVVAAFNIFAFFEDKMGSAGDLRHKLSIDLY